MFRAVLLAIVTVSLAVAQSLTVAQLTTFLESAAKQNTDKETAAFLAKHRLSERLDARGVESLTALGIGPKTRAALEKLVEQSSGLGAPKAVVLPEKPKPAPPPSSEEQAATLAAVREYALAYSHNLPDFICAQVTRRKIAPTTTGKYKAYNGSYGPSWQTIDTLTLRLSYFDQKENYKLILRNNMPVTEDYEKIGGPKAFGDFGSLMRELFEPATLARFEWDHWGTLRGRPVIAFSYHVPLGTSKYRLAVVETGQSVLVGYHGIVEVDRATNEIMRIKVEAENIPETFPLRSAETLLDYDFQDLSGHPFLLPMRSRVVMAGADVPNAIDQEFRLYRKYSAESELKFDAPILEPMPDSK